MIHPERDDWARQLTALRQQMAEQAASLDASGEFPWRNIDHLRAGGWLSLAVPPSCGGAGASLAQLQQVIAAIAWGEPATALIVCMQYLHHLRLAENDAWHAPLRQQVFHDAVEHGGLINSLRVEPELGSPARGGLPDTVATRRAEGWDISGHKIYTTGIEGLRWLAVWARSDDNPPLVGTPEQVADALLDYYDLGVRNFLIRGFDPLNDAADYGRALLPIAREKAARRAVAERAS